jgi:hypothetical protein
MNIQSEFVKLKAHARAMLLAHLRREARLPAPRVTNPKIIPRSRSRVFALSCPPTGRSMCKVSWKPLNGA